jgi:hypothetical protein
MSNPRTKHCKKCLAPIVFLITKTKPIDVDADTAGEQDTHYDPTRHVKHADTCEPIDERRRRL